VDAIPWFKVDDGLVGNKKFSRIPRGERMAATGLWTTAGSWCARELTDGFVPEHMVSEMGGTSRQAASLVSACLWVTASGGYQFVNWDEYQPTREQVESERAAAKARQQKARDKARQLRESGIVTLASRRDDPVTNGVSHGSVTPGVTGPPTRPDPAPKRERQPLPASRFAEFWSAYPIKKDRTNAEKAYEKQIKSGVSHDEIMVGLSAYVRSLARPGAPLPKYAQGWLNGKRWEDEYDSATSAPAGDWLLG
jgi:hypothetical protein